MRTTYVRSSYENRTTLQSTIQSLNRFGVTRMQLPVRELLIIIKFINFLFIFNYPSKDFFISISSNFPGKFPTHLPVVRASDACRTCTVRRAYAFGNGFLQYRYNYVRYAYDARTIICLVVRISYVCRAHAPKHHPRVAALHGAGSLLSTLVSVAQVILT